VIRPADAWVLIAALAGFVLYGLHRARQTHDLSGFLVANRAMPWPIVALSVMATQASAVTFMATPGQGYTAGLSFVQFYLGLPLAMVILCATLVPLYQRLRVSTAVRDRLADLAEPVWPVDLAGDEHAQRRALRHLGLARYRDVALLRAAETGDAARAAELLAAAPRIVPPDFPIKGRDAMRLGLKPGPEIGRLLRAVEEWWEADDFRADRDACLARLKELRGA